MCRWVVVGTAFSGFLTHFLLQTTGPQDTSIRPLTPFVSRDRYGSGFLTLKQNSFLSAFLQIHNCPFFVLWLCLVLSERYLFSPLTVSMSSTLSLMSTSFTVEKDIVTDVQVWSSGVKGDSTLLKRLSLHPSDLSPRIHRTTTKPVRRYLPLSPLQIFVRATKGTPRLLCRFWTYLSPYSLNLPL